MLNESFITNVTQPISQYIPTQKCADWCITNQVTNYNNMEIYAIIPVVISLTCIYIAEYCNEKEEFKMFSSTFYHMAKVSIYIFFFLFFVVIRLRLYYYGF